MKIYWYLFSSSHICSYWFWFLFLNPFIYITYWIFKEMSYFYEDMMYSVSDFQKKNYFKKYLDIVKNIRVLFKSRKFQKFFLNMMYKLATLATKKSYPVNKGTISIHFILKTIKQTFFYLCVSSKRITILINRRVET